MRRWGLILLVLVFGCSAQARPAASDAHLGTGAAPDRAATAPPASSTASTTLTDEGPDPGQGPLAVLVDRPVASERYTISLVALDGSRLATMTARQPAVSMAAPLTSTTLRHAYYLDGGQVMSLERDGSAHRVATVPAGLRLVSAFAVSAFDSQIAVSTIDYSDQPARVHMKLYVEDTYTGAHHVDLFESDSVVEWPVAWPPEGLIVAVGDSAPPPGGYGNPAHTRYGYHVVDPTTGNRKLTMSDSCVYGPPSPGGTACVVDGRPATQSWLGQITAVRPDGSVAGDHMLPSPGASRVAAVERGGARILVGGTLPAGFSGPTGTPAGWLDEQHLVFSRAGSGELAILHVHSGAVTPLALSAEVVGVVFGGHG